MRLTLATRRSALALAQSRAFAEELMRAVPGLEVDELQVVTSGDITQDRSLQDIGGKGLFIKELEEALLSNRAQFAVHSMKDVPAELAPGLELACVPPREDPRDAFISRDGSLLGELKPGSRVGTSSLRRALLMQHGYPHLEVIAVRGNVDTRLRKMEQGEFEALILAVAGLKRLGLEKRITQIINPDELLPAVGQGVLGIECRADDHETQRILASLIDPLTEVCIAAERAFMRAVDGNCRMPVAAFAIREGETFWLRGLIAETDGSRLRTGERRALWSGDVLEATKLGRDLGEELKRA